MAKSAFVTGATGFVGFSVARSLVERGIRVRALARKTSRQSMLRALMELGAELVIGDILDPGSYKGAFKGMSYVFHE